MFLQMLRQAMADIEASDIFPAVDEPEFALGHIAFGEILTARVAFLPLDEDGEIRFKFGNRYLPIPLGTFGRIRIIREFLHRRNERRLVFDRR